MHFIDDWNRHAYKRQTTPFHLQKAPGADEKGERGRIQYHIGVLQNLLREGILHKVELEGTKLALYLREIPQKDLQKCTDFRFPGPAALGYASIALETFPAPEEVERECREGKRYWINFWGWMISLQKIAIAGNEFKM